MMNKYVFWIIAFVLCFLSGFTGGYVIYDRTHEPVVDTFLVTRDESTSVDSSLYHSPVSVIPVDTGSIPYRALFTIPLSNKGSVELEVILPEGTILNEPCYIQYTLDEKQKTIIKTETVLESVRDTLTIIKNAGIVARGKDCLMGGAAGCVGGLLAPKITEMILDKVLE